MPADLKPLLDDLAAESAVVGTLLDPLARPDWGRPTPAAGWTIADQVTHLAYFDDVTLRSITDPDQFRRDAEALAADGDDYPDRVAAAHRQLDGDTLRSWFRTSRQGLLDGYARCDPATRLRGSARTWGWPPRSRPGSWRPGPTARTLPTLLGPSGR